MELSVYNANIMVIFSVFCGFETFQLIYYIECGNQTVMGSLRVAGGLTAEDRQWPNIGLAISDNLQCTATISMTDLNASSHAMESNFFFRLYSCTTMGIGQLFVYCWQVRIL